MPLAAASAHVHLSGALLANGDAAQAFVHAQVRVWVLRVQGPGSRVHGPGSRVQGPASSVQGVGFALTVCAQPLGRAAGPGGQRPGLRPRPSLNRSIRTLTKIS